MAWHEFPKKYPWWLIVIALLVIDFPQWFQSTWGLFSANPPVPVMLEWLRAVNVDISMPRFSPYFISVPLGLAMFLWLIIEVRRSRQPSGSGNTAFVNLYFPASGLTNNTIVRVINNGTVGGPVTGTFIGTDGSIMGSGTIIANLPAGGAHTLTAQQIEAAIGVTVPGKDRPRLKISAAYNGITLQVYRYDVGKGELIPF